MELGLLGAAGVVPVIVVVAAFRAANLRRGGQMEPPAAPRMGFLFGPAISGLVLADFAMPEMSGGELAKVICAMRPTLPVILITGYSDVDVLKEFNDLRIILKPFTEDDLVNTISAALG